MQLKNGGKCQPSAFSGTSGSLIGLCIINECFCSMAFFFPCVSSEPFGTRGGPINADSRRSALGRRRGPT